MIFLPVDEPTTAGGEDVVARRLGGTTAVKRAGAAAAVDPNTAGLVAVVLVGRVLVGRTEGTSGRVEFAEGGYG